ncbi:MAG: branched-chain amino acid ABC transporter permease [Oscillospiraceae bacterium]|nr:branched-chain amino acid ABC transporter permease [Oscillospiraceae bacterium]
MNALNLKKMNKTSRSNFLTYGIVIVVYALVQLLNGMGALSSSMEGMLVPICAYVIMAVSLNLTVGILGELSLGHAGFMSVGAFTGVATSMALLEVIPSPLVRMLIGIAVGAIFAAIVGFLIGIPVLRLKGDYLAIVTLAFGEIIKSIFNNLFMGIGPDGFRISLLEDTTGITEAGGSLLIAGPLGISGVKTYSSFTLGIILVIVTLFIIFNLVNSRAGRAIMAIRDNRIAAESVGVNVVKYKMMAFVTSAALAGAAGVLFGMNYSTVIANKFDFNTSILVLVFVVLGGQGNMLGSIIAAAALTILPEALREFATYRMLVYAIVLILVMLGTNNPEIKAFMEHFSIRKRLGSKKAEKSEGKEDK